MKMMHKMMLCTLVILAAAAAAPAEQRVDATRSVAADATISIENVAGSLTITGSDSPEVRITGAMGDDVEELEISGDASDLSIEVVIPDSDDRRGERKIAADLEVQVPSGATLEIETVSATVEIGGVRGDIEAESVSGSVDVEGGTGDIDVESVSGSVSVSGGSSVVAESVSGRVALVGASGDIEATTVSGEIEVQAGAVGDVEIESVSGGVRFQGTPGGESELEVESHSGNVELLLPAGLGAKFELETFSGGIDNGFGPPAQRADHYEPGLTAEFVTGAGGAEVSVQTFSGNIVLKSF
jgi:DUF4097 and DUF4098 domain-containing protein YvlB